MKITSLEQLKDWNNQYILGMTLRREPDESNWPILLEWFLDWFFEEALLNIETAREAFNEYVDFTYICTDLSQEAALGRCLSNLNFWYNRASYYNSRSKQFKKFKAECL